MALWFSRAPPHHTLSAFLNLNTLSGQLSQKMILAEIYAWLISWLKFRRGSLAGSWIGYTKPISDRISEYTNRFFNFLNSSNYFRTVRIKRSGQLKRNANYFQLTGFSRDLWKRSKNFLPDHKKYENIYFSSWVFFLAFCKSVFGLKMSETSENASEIFWSK